MKRMFLLSLFMTACSTTTPTPKVEVTDTAPAVLVDTVTLVADVSAPDVTDAADVADTSGPELDVTPVLAPKVSVEAPKAPTATDGLDASLPEAVCCPCD